MKFKMADSKPEIEIHFERKEMTTRLQRFPHWRPFWGCPTLIWHCRHPDHKTAASKPKIEITFEKK